MTALHMYELACARIADGRSEHMAHAMRWLLCHGGYNDRITSAERRYIARLMHG